MERLSNTEGEMKKKSVAYKHGDISPCCKKVRIHFLKLKHSWENI